jgi:hypothetical protein
MRTVEEKLLIRPSQGWLSRLAHGFLRHMARRRAYLDIRDLSPHLKRDMGFLDGNDPSRHV